MQNEEDRVLLDNPGADVISNLLWLSKDRVNQFAVKARCTFTLPDGNDLCAYVDTRTHIGVPREFARNSGTPLISLLPTSWEHIEWSCTAESRDVRDVNVWANLQDAQSGILHLACGRGKTVHALRKIAHEKGPAIVFVHTKDLLAQWIERAYQWLRIDDLPIEPRHIGIISGTRSITEENLTRPLVIALMQTVARAAIGECARKRFKIAVYDEVHHLAARTWMGLGAFGYGIRLGLSATPYPANGAYALYNLHTGAVFYSDTAQEVVPDCYFVRVPGKVDLGAPDVRDVTGALSIGKLLSHVACIDTRNQVIAARIQRAVESGRCVLALSGSKAHVENLCAMFPGSGLCTGDVQITARNHEVQHNNLIFGTMPLGKEGLDRKELDVVFVLTPFRDENMLQQVVGRVQRPYGKPPIAVFFDDFEVPPLHSLCNSLRKTLRRWGFPVRDVSA